MNLSANPTIIELDTVIMGGGIAGLWLANRLHNAGFTIALFEHKALGSDQTMASQGMIHGGMKYTLNGALTTASETIADMPEYWRACLCGEGDVDLRQTRILSDHFYLWSGDSLSAKLSSFLASKATRGRVDKVPDDRRPPLFRNEVPRNEVLRHKNFNGSLYKLSDIVLDVHSLVTNLAHNIADNIFSIDWSQATLEKNAEGTLHLNIAHENQNIHVRAQRFIFCAGKGNAELMAQLGLSTPAMQLRPLQQVLVKHKHPFVFFGHCLGAETTPRLTISTHSLNQHERVWYLGGSLAEKGVGMDAEHLIAQAQFQLNDLLPWVDLTGAEWATLPINRAEPRQANFARPDNAFVSPVQGCRNAMVAWPTKLTLAPNLANQVLELFHQNNIVHHNNIAHQENIAHAAHADHLRYLHQILPTPPIAATPWELAFPSSVDTEAMLEKKFAALQADPRAQKGKR
jgi:FAD dependent oxidoreductase